MVNRSMMFWEIYLILNNFEILHKVECLHNNINSNRDHPSNSSNNSLKPPHKPHHKQPLLNPNNNSLNSPKINNFHLNNSKWCPEELRLYQGQFSILKWSGTQIQQISKEKLYNKWWECSPMQLRMVVEYSILLWMTWLVKWKMSLWLMVIKDYWPFLEIWRCKSLCRWLRLVILKF